MSPHDYLNSILRDGDRVLSLCCGIGQEFKRVAANIELTGVDIVPEYIAEYQRQWPAANAVCADVLDYLRHTTDSFDYAICIDGIEHLPKKAGRQLTKEAKRVARVVIIFTPDRFTKNEPEHTWGIDGGDHYQLHLSAWPPEDLRKLGFAVVYQSPSTTSLGQAFNESMYRYDS